MKQKAFWLFISLFTVSLPAMAYIDPGSGSAIMSAIVGLFVAVGLAVKTFWYKIKSFFCGKKPQVNQVPTEDKKENASK